MKTAYPIVLTPVQGMYAVTIPDLDISTKALISQKLCIWPAMLSECGFASNKMKADLFHLLVIFQNKNKTR